jgi:type II secretory pathway pseudopilin PulG
VSRRLGGFSLIELTVVLLIVVILLTLGAGAIGLASSNAAISQTRKKQELIKEALSAYVGKYKRVPCPDTDLPPNGLGEENRANPNDPATDCTADVGVVPYVDLGLPKDYALDGWDNFFTYRVTKDGSAALDWTKSNPFYPGKPGKLDVSIRSSVPPYGATPLTNTDKAVVVVVSHGKNGLGARTLLGTFNQAPAGGSDEEKNADPAAPQYIQRELTDVAVPTFGAYDDMVVFLKAADLVAPLIKDGTMRSAEGETNYKIGLVADDVISRFISDPTNNVPAPSTGDTPPGGVVTDGWGSPLRYYQCTLVPITQTTPTPSTAIAFRVLSDGANRALLTGACALPALGDDVTYDVSVGTLRTIGGKVGKYP